MPFTATVFRTVAQPLREKLAQVGLPPLAITIVAVIGAHVIVVSHLGIHPAGFALVVGLVALIALLAPRQLAPRQAVAPNLSDSVQTQRLTARISDMERRNAALQSALTLAQSRVGSLRAHCDDLAVQLTIDPLTGVQNRRGLEAAFAAQPVGSIMALLDIDHFKRINDTLGHDVGDRVLRDFATRLRACLPMDVPVYRVGGEEFVVLVPRANMQNVSELLDTFRRDLLVDTMIRQNDRVSVSFSAGLALVENAAQDFETVFKKADERLYMAKSTGRGKTISTDKAPLHTMAAAA